MRHEGRDLRDIEFFQTDAQRYQYRFGSLARRHFENMVLLDGKVVGIAHCKAFKEFIQNACIFLIFLPHFRCREHFHHHREILLFGRGFVSEIEDQRFQQSGLRAFPKGIVGIGAFRRSIADQIVYQLQHVFLVAEVGKRVIPVAFLHIDEIQNTDNISLLFKQLSGIPQNFSLAVQHYERRVSLHDVRLGIEPCFTGSAAADHEHIEIAPVPASVKSDPRILCENNIVRKSFIRIFFGQ